MRKSHQRRRAEIAAAALEVLASGGPRQLTARKLGAAVGMDGSSLFRHFENKAAILHAALDEFEGVLEACFPEGAHSWEGLREFFLRRLTLVQARPEVIRLAFNPHLLEVSGEREHAERVRRVVQRSVAFIRGCLEDAQGKGLIPDTVAAAALVWVVTGVLRGAALGSVQSRPAPEQAWRWLAEVLQHSRSSEE